MIKQRNDPQVVQMQCTEFDAFARTFLGRPYIWGADGPDSFDCSGFAQTLLGRIGIDPPGDQTADGLFRHFSQPSHGTATLEASCGCLVFYGKPSRIGHVAICLDSVNMIEAGGGGSETTSIAIATAQGAEVRIRPIRRRRDIVAIIRPLRLPWPVGMPSTTARTFAGEGAELLSDLEAEAPAGAAEVRELATGQELPRQLAAVRDFYWPAILEGAGEANVLPSLVCGIGSKESAWGLSRLLRPGPGPASTGDWTRRKPKPPLRPGTLPPDNLGFGRGLMQIDYDSHPFARHGDWQDARENILYGCSVLRQNIVYFQRQGFDAALGLRAAIAGYNAGPGRVFEAIRREGPQAVDAPTTGGNYSASVIELANWFRASGVDRG